MRVYVVSEIIFYVGYSCEFDEENYIILTNDYSFGFHWCDRVHETGQTKGFCSVLTLKKDIRELQPRGLWDPWDFSLWGLELRSASCMLDIVSTISKKSEMKFMESSDQDIKRYGLGIDSFHQYSFNFCLVILIYFLCRSYGVTNWSKEVYNTIFIYHFCAHCSCFCIGNNSRGIRLFLGTPVYAGTI